MVERKDNNNKVKAREDYPITLEARHVQEILGIGKRKAYELMDENGFPCVKIGRLKRVNRDKFFDWYDGLGAS
nr:helix-turn-helix domain-containing protein [Cytobacillus horneckiae]